MISKLICCSERGDLVEKELALAPLDWVETKVTIFPKRHLAIATSWSLPTSECSSHCRFEDHNRRSVRFQLDLERAGESSSPKLTATDPPGHAPRKLDQEKC